MRRSLRHGWFKVALLTVLISAAPREGIAMASKTVLELAAENASVFDIGLMRLESFMTQHWQHLLMSGKDVEYVTCSVRYDFDANKIVVHLSVDVAGELTKEQLKNAALMMYMAQPFRDTDWAWMFKTSGRRSLESANINYEEIRELVYYEMYMFSASHQHVRMMWRQIDGDISFSDD